MKNPMKYTEEEERRWKILMGKKYSKHERKESRTQERREHRVYC